MTVDVTHCDGVDAKQVCAPRLDVFGRGNRQYEISINGYRIVELTLTEDEYRALYHNSENALSKSPTVEDVRAKAAQRIVEYCRAGISHNQAADSPVAVDTLKQVVGFIERTFNLPASGA
tara:strand:- start:5228 stop:5587 length:360 start_codon:yes stop_codon:yes gene_type:complete